MGRTAILFAQDNSEPIKEFYKAVINMSPTVDSLGFQYHLFLEGMFYIA